MYFRRFESARRSLLPTDAERLMAACRGSYPLRREFDSRLRYQIYSPLAQGQCRRLITVRAKFNSWRDYQIE